MKSLKTTLINLRRAPYKSLATIVMITITFFVAYGFSLFLVGSQQVLRFFETQPKIIAFFDIKTETEDIKKVEAAVSQLTYVDSVKIVSKEEAFRYYQEKQDNPLLLELVTADILPASIEISATSPENLSLIHQELKQFSQIDDIIIQQDVVEQLTQWVQSLRVMGLALTIIFFTLSLLIIMSTISFKISHQKKKINILRFIGANSSFILKPYIIEGFLYGFLGSIFGWILIYAGLLYITPWLKTLVGQIILFPIPWEFFLIQVALGTSLALFFGGFASVLAAKRLIEK
jgi:cell division transport system permease protein